VSEALQGLSTHLAGKFGDKIAKSEIVYGELTVTVAGEDIVDVVSFLRDDPACQFISFIDVSGADYPSREKRFDVVYHLLSPKKNLRIRVRVLTDEDTPVPSITGVYPGADWYERETYDLYGVLFSGHPDLRVLPGDE
jgi:NADH-quinone oxidoreductase subunit C